MSEGLRSAKYQNELWRKGRFTKPLGRQYVVTHRDGYLRKSNHQSGLAADIAFKDEAGNVSWHPPAGVWEYYGHLCRKHRLAWGGDWKTFIDRPHCEWPATESAAYKQARRWLKAKRLG